MAVDGYSLCVPILLTEKDASGHRIEGEIIGTAWYIRAGFFVTAGHVATALRAARAHLTPILGFKANEKGDTEVAAIEDSENLAGDVAILRTNPTIADRRANVLTWWMEPVGQLQDVSTAGFAFGLHRGDESVQLVLRSFKGSIVGGMAKYRLLGDSSPPGDVYELSFQAPRGLSGAPLMMEVARRARAIGVVIGNSEYKTLVHSVTEVDKDATTTTVVERYETLSLGLATQGMFVAQQDSKLLGGTVREHLAKHGLLASHSPS